MEKDWRNENQLFYIKGNIPSLKNSKQFVKSINKLVPSKSVGKYNKNLWQWRDESEINRFKDLSSRLQKPLLLGFHLIRDSRRRWDFCNGIQLPQDVMVKNGWIDDDNVFELIPVPMLLNGKFNTVNKEYAGIIFKILDYHA